MLPQFRHSVRLKHMHIWEKRHW